MYSNLIHRIWFKNILVLIFIFLLFFKNDKYSFFYALFITFINLILRPNLVFEIINKYFEFILTIFILTFCSILINVLFYSNYEFYSLLVLVRTLIYLIFLYLHKPSKITWIRLIYVIALINSIVSILQVYDSDFYLAFLEKFQFLNINLGDSPVLYRSVGFHSGPASNSVLSGLYVTILILFWKTEKKKLSIFDYLVLFISVIASLVSGRTGLFIILIAFFFDISFLINARFILISIFLFTIIYILIDLSNNYAVLNILRITDLDTLRTDAKDQFLFFRESSSILELLIGRNSPPRSQYILNKFYSDGLLYQLIDVHGILVTTLLLSLFFYVYFVTTNLSYIQKFILFILILLVFYKGNYLYTRPFFLIWFLIFTVFSNNIKSSNETS